MVSLIELVTTAQANFSLAEGLTILKPLTLFIIGIAIYSWFIFKFYRFVARREIFKFKLKEKMGLHVIGYIFKYLILFPLLTFFWFIVLSVILAFLSKQDSMQTVLLISMALVGVIRLTAYYNEDLSKDLAKMLPFALLGVFLVDVSYFSIDTSLSAIYQIPSLWKSIVYYLLFIILLEFILRFIYGIVKLVKHKNSSEKNNNPNPKRLSAKNSETL